MLPKPNTSSKEIRGVIQWILEVAVVIQFDLPKVPLRGKAVADPVFGSMCQYWIDRSYDVVKRQQPFAYGKITIPVYHDFGRTEVLEKLMTTFRTLAYLYN